MKLTRFLTSWHVYLLCVPLAFAASAGVSAQRPSTELSVSCPAAGATVTPLPFDTVASALAPLARPKGEYETTASFQTRQRSAATMLKPTYLVSVPLLSRNIYYDADSQVLSIPAAALGGLVAPDYDRTVSNDFIGNKIGAGLHNIDVIAAQSVTPTGNYGAQNVLGATTRITKFRKVTKAIFDRAGGWQETLFDPPFEGEGWRQEYEALDVPMTPTFAQAQRQTLRAAVLIAPRPPWLLKGKELRSSPTLDKPNDFDATVAVITARIQCVVILDRNGKVVAGRGVRRP